MSALGMETSIDKFKNSGIKPFYLSFILFIWLMIVGYFLVILGALKSQMTDIMTLKLMNYPKLCALTKISLLNMYKHKKS